MSAKLLFVSIVFFLVACAPAQLETSRAQPSPEVVAQCAALSAAKVADTQIGSAELVWDRPDLPEFCHIEGLIADRIGFAVRLPVQNWNGKFVVAGCGGFCGSLLPDKPGHSNSINEALKSGYAAITTDGGHRAESWDTDWALADSLALDLFAGAWMPMAVTTGKALLNEFYEGDPKRTYFSGCSNGGRLAMMAAQRYPELFDGIAGGAGIFDLTGNAGVHGLWKLQTLRDDLGQPTIDRRKIPLLEEEVMRQCDALDGVDDGVVSRPDLCQPKLSVLQCGATLNDGCFSETELAAIQRLYQGATVNGVRLFPGITPGSEFLWPLWVTGTKDVAAWGPRAVEGTLRLTYNIPTDQPFNAHDYELADELENLQRLAPVLNATDPDLSAFEQAGGKLFYYHGLADPLILPGRAQQYYEEVVAVMGKDKLDQFARFVMVPGHGHCWEKPGQVADDFNPLLVIDKWVESGVAPDHVIAVQKNTEGGIIRSRKLCPLPKIAQLRGGDQTQADSYECVNPL